MIERPMPQDIMKFKAKLIAGLTARQIVWGGIAGVVAIGTYFALGDVEFASGQMKVIVSAIPALPFFAMGFMTIMEMPLEKVAIPLLIDNFIAPPVRKKEIHNPGYEKFQKAHYGEYETVREDQDEDEEASKKKKKKEKSGTYKCIKSKEYIGIK